MTNDKANLDNEADADAVEAGASFADQVRSLTDDQLQAVKTLVNEEAGKRTPPDLGNMSEQEFQAYKAKHGL